IQEIKLFFFQEKEFEIISQLTESILPETDTPGAIAAGVPQSIDLIVADCFEEEDRDAFRAALADFRSEFQNQNKKAFLDADEATKLAYLNSCEEEWDNTRKEADQSIAELFEEGKVSGRIAFWQAIKDMTLRCYFASEPGATKALVYVPVPTKYEACIPVDANTKNWASVY
ncbi:MAG: gluconate 2-dehydrogenase subunit 3 family protein, partial [Bacteroidota bacterium]